MEQKKSIKEESEFVSLLSFIENNTAKEDFIAWLNTEQNKTFSEEDTWEHIKLELQSNDTVAFGELQTYAKSLGSQQDVKKILEDVDKSTKKAEQTVERLTYLTSFKKFSVAVGGASVFVGLLFFVFAFAILFRFIGVDMSDDVHTAVVGLSIFVGVLNVVSGLLLATR